MLFHTPDPAYTRSPRAQANFRLALKLATGFVVLLWLIHVANWVFGLGLTQFGVRPRSIDGLAGIAFGPLLHTSFSHLFSNSLPLLVLGTMMLHLYPSSSLRVLPLLHAGPGLIVWLFGRASIHVGASGLVYGLAAYIFLSGVLRRDRRAIAATLLVGFLYGGMVWGVLPIQPGVSWETHLAAALIGIALAIRYRDLDVPPTKRYDWEDEPADPPTSR